MWDRYYSAASLEEALGLLAGNEGRLRVVAGATDLVLELERGQRPEVRDLVDISRVPGLDRIGLGDDGWVHLGPLVTHNQCVASPLLVQRASALAHACWQVGAPQIRNRGTVCGNLVTASPANDAIPPLLAFGAVLRLRSARGERLVPLDRFYTGVRQTVLTPDEIVVDLSFPLPSAETRSAFIKLGLRRAQAISVVNAAVVLELQDGEVRQARIALGSVAPTVIRAQRAEEYLAGRPLTAEAMAQAADLAALAASPIDDLRATAEYRREMVRVCVRRALQTDEGRAGFPDRPVLLSGRGIGQRPSGPASMVGHGRGQLIRTTINGQRFEFRDAHDKTLLRLLREDAGLTGTKEGCDEGECGACTVFLDGAAVMACLVPAPRAHEADIVTVEGLARHGVPHPLQTAFVEQAAVQCGYCTPGFLMAGAKLLEERPHPDRDEIAQAVAGNLCRCTGYYSILSAIEQAAQQAVVDDPGARG